MHNVFVGIFADEPGQYMLRAFLLLCHVCVGELRKNPSFNSAVLDRVHLWDDELYQKDIATVLTTFPKLKDCYRRKFAEYVAAMRPGKKLCVTPALLLSFVRAFVKRMSVAESVRDGTFFVETNALTARILCMDWIRATLDQFESSSNCARVVVEVAEEPDVAPSDSVSNAPNSPSREEFITIDLGH